MNKPILYSIALLAAVGVGYALISRNETPPQAEQVAEGTAPDAATGTAMIVVKTVALSGNAVLGETAFNAKCAACHGANAAGNDGKAPPLVHKYYEPGHHSDQAFLIAVRNGVQAHHWPFGNMPPVDGLTDSDVANIVTYVRTLQRANGIE